MYLLSCRARKWLIFRQLVHHYHTQDFPFRVRYWQLLELLFLRVLTCLTLTNVSYHTLPRSRPLITTSHFEVGFHNFSVGRRCGYCVYQRMNFLTLNNLGTHNYSCNTRGYLPSYNTWGFPFLIVAAGLQRLNHACWSSLTLGMASSIFLPSWLMVVDMILRLALDINVCS